MNMTDRAELSELMHAVWEVFQGVVRVEQKKEIEKVISFMDRHQQILAGDVEE